MNPDAPKPEQEKSKEEIQEILNNVDHELISQFLPLAKAIQIYHRYHAVGLENIPEGEGALLVVNHSLATYDILLLGLAIYRKLDRLPRGLADSSFYKNKMVGDFVKKVGMIEGTRVNAQELLKLKQLVVVAPGGMRESLRPSSERYQIRWGKRKGFIVMSIATQKPIVLAACPKADDLFEVHSNWFTKYIYKEFRLPWPYVSGLGGLSIPRPIKLTHYLSEPIYPPKWNEEDGDMSQEMIDNYHSLVVGKMVNMMQEYSKD